MMMHHLGVTGGARCGAVQRGAAAVVAASVVQIQIKARLQANVHRPYVATAKYYITVCNVDSPTGCQIYFTKVNKVLFMEYAHDAAGPPGASTHRVGGRGGGDSLRRHRLLNAPRGRLCYTPQGVAAIFTRHRFVQGVKARHL